MNRLIMVLALLLAGLSGFTQKVFTEGMIQYDINVINGKDQPNLVKAFEGASQFVWFKGSQVRVDFNSNLRSQTTFYDAKDGSVVILKESGQEKYLMNLDREKWSDYNKKFKGIKYSFSNETKTVAGLVCKKATGKFADGQIVVWYCPDLMPYTTGYEYAFIEVPGMPLAYEMTMGKFTVEYVASSVQTTPVSMSKFDLPKSGYKIL